MQVLKRKYPSSESPWTHLARAVVFGLFVFAFLAIFTPFKIDSGSQGRNLVYAGYGLICFATMVVLNVLTPEIFRGYFSEEKWNVGKEVFWTLTNLIVIGVLNALYSFEVFNIPNKPSLLLQFMGYTAAIGVFPLLGIALLNQTRLNRKFETLSENINPNIPAPKRTDEAEIIIPSTNQDDDVKALADDMLAFNSADNYVEIYTENGRYLVRNTLRNLEKVLEDHAQFIRCHKGWIVNLNKVERVSGNAQGLKLHLENFEIPVPVSRSLTNDIRDRIK